MKPEDLQTNDIVQVDRIGPDEVHRVFVSWVVRPYGLGDYSHYYYIWLLHDTLGERSEDPRGASHNVERSTITLIHRPSSVQERDLFIALHPDL